MPKGLGIALFGIIVFAATAAGTWWVRTQLQPEQPETAATQGGPAEGTGGASSALPTREPVADTAATSSPGNGLLPVAIRPRAMSVEELLRYGMSLKEREKVIQQQEEQLQKRQIQQQLALADIQGERREIDGLRVQIRDHLQAAESMIEKLNKARQELVEEKDSANKELQKVKEAQIEVDANQFDNTKRLSQWIQNMDADKAGQLLQKMADDGEMEMAVRILANFEEREAAKILSAIDDVQIVQEFAKKFQNYKNPTKVKQASRRQ